MNDSDKQMLHSSFDIEKFQSKVRQTEKVVTMMDEKAFECTHLAELKSDLSYVVKRNGLKRISEKSKNDIVVLEKEIKVLEDKKGKLQI